MDGGGISFLKRDLGRQVAECNKVSHGFMSDFSMNEKISP
jgi:hypothetical protein